MNILEWIVNKTGNAGHSEYEMLNKACDKYYGRFLMARRNQYGRFENGTPPPIFAFLALDSDCAKALDCEPGSLVRNKLSNRYYIIDMWCMSGLQATIKGHDKDGNEMIMCAAEFEPADIPSEVVELAMNQLRKKCPLVCGKEGE